MVVKASGPCLTCPALIDRSSRAVVSIVAEIELKQPCFGLLLLLLLRTPDSGPWL